MATKIERDRNRFREIVKGKVRQNLREYVSHGEMLGRKGKDIVSIPVPSLNVPRFRYGNNKTGGVGKGDGQIGQPLGPGQDDGGPGTAGNEPGQHILEVDVTLAELAEIMADELQLPRIEPKGNASVIDEKHRYNSIRTTGPDSLRHFRRTYVRALRRQIATGHYDARQPRVVPIKDDTRFRAWNTVSEPQANAAVIYIMDVSGSMTDEQKHIVRTEAFWIDTWLQNEYDGVERRYIIHDAAAKEVDEHTFYHTRESGGTRISAAYQTCTKMIEREFPVADWNIYCFQFSDGDNWGEDSQHSMRLLKQELLPVCNLFCYGQVESPYGSGDYLHTLIDEFGNDHDILVTSEIANQDGIYDSIKCFLGKGK